MVDVYIYIYIYIYIHIYIYMKLTRGGLLFPIGPVTYLRPGVFNILSDTGTQYTPMFIYTPPATEEMNFCLGEVLHLGWE